MKRLIKRIIRNKSNGQLLLTIPKNFGYEEGEWVELIKVPEPQINKMGEYVWNKKQH